MYLKYSSLNRPWCSLMPPNYLLVRYWVMTQCLPLISGFSSLLFGRKHHRLDVLTEVVPVFIAGTFLPPLWPPQTRYCSEYYEPAVNAASCVTASRHDVVHCCCDHYCGLFAKVENPLHWVAWMWLADKRLLLNIKFTKQVVDSSSFIFHNIFFRCQLFLQRCVFSCRCPQASRGPQRLEQLKCARESRWYLCPVWLWIFCCCSFFFKESQAELRKKHVGACLRCNRLLRNIEILFCACTTMKTAKWLNPMHSNHNPTTFLLTCRLTLSGERCATFPRRSCRGRWIWGTALTSCKVTSTLWHCCCGRSGCAAQICFKVNLLKWMHDVYLFMHFYLFFKLLMEANNAAVFKVQKVEI